jgi:hypothetical protein
LNVAMIAYKCLEDSEKNIYSAWKSFSSLRPSSDEIRYIAQELLSLLNNNHKAASLLWDRLSKEVRIPHYDHNDHTDNEGHNNSDCHSDHGGQSNFGQFEFPPYPFND